jgi:hypothetical protein
MELQAFLRDDGSGHLEFVWHPGSATDSHLNVYRRPLNELRGVVSDLVTG